jgi:type IV pilus assembly protein PilA
MSILRPTVSLLLSACLIVAGCGKGKNGSSTSSTGNSAPSTLPTAEVKASIKAIPADAAAVATLALPFSLADAIGDNSFIPMDPKVSKELQEALRAHFKKHVGLDLAKAQSAVAFLAGTPPAAAVIVSPVSGSLNGATDDPSGAKIATLLPGEKIIAAHRQNVLVVGMEPAVRAALEVMSGKAEGLAKGNADFYALVDDNVSGSYLSVTADIEKLPIPANPMTAGLQRAGIRIAGDTFHLTVHGKKDTLEMLAAQAKGGLQIATNMARQNMEQSSESLAEGTAGILGYYMAKNLSALLDPKIDGDRLDIDLPMFGGGSSGTVFVAVIGILAAVAIPAFIKYIKKSKSSEAAMMLRRNFEALRVLAMDGQPMPASVGPTPPLGTCCAQDPEDGKCRPDPSYWQHPSWQALQFSIADPSYFSYELINDGTTLELRAYGDLDCDGEYSTFSMSTSATNIESAMPDLLKRDELE